MPPVLDEIIPETIAISLRRSEPPPVTGQLVLEEGSDHYVPEPPVDQEQLPAGMPEPQPCSTTPAPATTHSAPPEPVQMHEAPHEPRAAEPTLVAQPQTVQAPLVKSAVPTTPVVAPLLTAPAAPMPAPSVDGIAKPMPIPSWAVAAADKAFENAQPVFSTPEPSIRAIHLFAGLGVVAFIVMGVITYLWASEKLQREPVAVATVPAVATPAPAAPAESADPAAGELPEPIVIRSAPEPVATPHELPVAAPAAAAKPAHAAAPVPPKVIAPAKPVTAPVQAKPAVAATQPLAPQPVEQPRPQRQATPEPASARPAGGAGRGWAVRVESNGVVFFDAGKASLYRVGDVLPNGERLVDVDEGSATYATDKGVRQIRSSPLSPAR